VVEGLAYRITPHSSDDDDRTYRSREEVEENKQRDPLLIARKSLIEAGFLDEGTAQEMDARAKAMVEEAVKTAEQAQYPSPEDALGPVYAEEVGRG
jgi:2-oxoisovalerate dehydrogenase E1 component alpha subunit